MIAGHGVERLADDVAWEDELRYLVMFLLKVMCGNLA